MGNLPSGAFGQSWVTWVLLILVVFFALYLTHFVFRALPA